MLKEVLCFLVADASGVRLGYVAINLELLFKLGLGRPSLLSVQGMSCIVKRLAGNPAMTIARDIGSTS